MFLVVPMDVPIFIVVIGTAEIDGEDGSCACYCGERRLDAYALTSGTALGFCLRCLVLMIFLFGSRTPLAVTVQSCSVCEFLKMCVSNNLTAYKWAL